MRSAHTNRTGTSGLDTSLISVAPDGEVYTVPTPAQVALDGQQLRAEVTRQRLRGRKIVVVQGLGFVGSAVAAAVAAARSASGEALYYVIGVDVATAEAYWKVGKLKNGEVPFASPDPEFPRLVWQAVKETVNLYATASELAYGEADVIIVDVGLDVKERYVTDPREIHLLMDGFEAALRVVGRNMRPDALVLVETTVPIGACEFIVAPILEEERKRRGITQPLRLAHAYERVMPGPNYIKSIRQFWRTYSAVDPESAAQARTFLSSFIDTANYPLYELERPAASEMAKLIENSYRATNIAFIHEWTLLAEKIGVNLFDVIDSIRVRKGTHDNMRYPGFGVGGYCLTKDSYLAQWAALNIFHTDVTLDMTLAALRINYAMPRHTFDLLKELAGGDLKDMHVTICGVSYLPELPDTRNSPTEILFDELVKAGAVVTVHDPLVGRWVERPDVPVLSDLSVALREAEAVVFATAHRCYRELTSEFLASASELRVIIDAQNVLSDSCAAALHRSGRLVAGVGKGHWRRYGYHLSKS